MPSENYRYYCLDSTGKLHEARWLGADSDEDAIAQVQARHPEAVCEIWQERRLVASLGAGTTGNTLANNPRVTTSMRTLAEAGARVLKPARPSSEGDAR